MCCRVKKWRDRTVGMSKFKLRVKFCNHKDRFMKNGYVLTPPRPNWKFSKPNCQFFLIKFTLTWIKLRISKSDREFFKQNLEFSKRWEILVKHDCAASTRPSCDSIRLAFRKIGNESENVKQPSFFPSTNYSLFSTVAYSIRFPSWPKHKAKSPFHCWTNDG